LQERLAKQIALADERLNAAQAEAKARKAQAEADVASAELEEELLGQVNALRDKIEEGQNYLKELADAGEDQVQDLMARVEGFFDPEEDEEDGA
jgi:uncharacterized protein involved in exopolysaccharide biosynthesis